MNDKRIWTAGLAVIGDEILSGRTQDRNVAQIASWLNIQGIRLREVRVVADVEADESCSILEADDAQVMLAVFEGIRPFGRQWYLLYSDAIARSLRDEALRAELAEQRERMRNQIGALLATRLEASGERALLPVEDLAQLLMGIFIDLLVREQLEGRDVTQLAATTILGTLRAFIAPKSD